MNFWILASIICGLLAFGCLLAVVGDWLGFDRMAIHDPAENEAEYLARAARERWTKLVCFAAGVLLFVLAFWFYTLSGPAHCCTATIYVDSKKWVTIKVPVDQIVCCDLVNDYREEREFKPSGVWSIDSSVGFLNARSDDDRCLKADG